MQTREEKNLGVLECEPALSILNGMVVIYAELEHKGTRKKLRVFLGNRAGGVIKSIALRSRKSMRGKYAKISSGNGSIKEKKIQLPKKAPS